MIFHIILKLFFFNFLSSFIFSFSCSPICLILALFCSLSFSSLFFSLTVFFSLFFISCCFFPLIFAPTDLSFVPLALALSPVFVRWAQIFIFNALKTIRFQKTHFFHIQYWSKWCLFKRIFCRFAFFKHNVRYPSADSWGVNLLPCHTMNSTECGFNAVFSGTDTKTV